MKAKTFLAVVLLLGFLVAVSCDQGPIFYTVSTETLPLEPLISGSPTNMVAFDPGSGPFLFVASGHLYRYRGGGWGLSYSPGGKIIALAATDNYLYALCLTGYNVDTTLWRMGGDGWQRVRSAAGDYPLIQSIHADPDGGRLFAGARRNSNTNEAYAILYLDDTNPGSPLLKILATDTSILSGAAFRDGNHFLSTNGGGVFRVAESDLAANTVNVEHLPETGTQNYNREFMGMIKLENDTFIAVERIGGVLYKIMDDSFEKITTNGVALTTGGYATGALALWEGTVSEAGHSGKLLIAGIQGGLYNTVTQSYTYGYVEFDLNDDGSLNESALRRDQGRLLSVSDNNRYMASIGKHSINHLFQAPPEVDPNRTFFASTQIAGLWSYRDRNDGNGPQWNAEN
jgi:hypothetical protein